MKKNNFQKGFTLIEMAVVLLVMGLIVGSVFGFMSPQLEQRNISKTIEKQNRIARALSEFAQLRGVLPCPARPENITDSGAAPAACTTAALRDGIVPYRALGLTADDAIDGFGNPFTYGVARELTSNVSTTTHQNQRLDTVWVVSAVNVSPAKAILCGQTVSVGNQLEVYSNTAKTTHITDIQEDRPANNGVSAPPNTPAATVDADDNMNYFAYVLISHGKNGEGAYTINPITPQNGRRAFINASLGDRENAEATGGAVREYVALDRNDVSGNAYVDDIVLWRTQQGMIRETGDTTCARP